MGRAGGLHWIMGLVVIMILLITALAVVPVLSR
jgi:hypothetical protein